MTLVVALALAVLTFVFIAYPAFRQAPQEAVLETDDRLKDLESQRETTYSMLKELEFDHQSGILTDEDYRDLEQRYKRKAVTILKDMDAAETEADATAEEEQTAMSIEDEIEHRVRRMRDVHARFCSKCGAALMQDGRFCSSCGAEAIQ